MSFWTELPQHGGLSCLFPFFILFGFCFFSVSGPDSIICQAIWFCLQMMHSKLVNGVVVFHHEVAAKMKDKIVHIDL
jgi:hypothetical protein